MQLKQTHSSSWEAVWRGTLHTEQQHSPCEPQASRVSQMGGACRSSVPVVWRHPTPWEAQRGCLRMVYLGLFTGVLCVCGPSNHSAEGGERTNTGQPWRQVDWQNWHPNGRYSLEKINPAQGYKGPSLSLSLPILMVSNHSIKYLYSQNVFLPSCPSFSECKLQSFRQQLSHF